VHYLIINRTRTDLTPDQYRELAGHAKQFYDNVPAGLTLHSDWGAMDGSCTYAIMEADDRDLLDRVQAPFRPFVDMEVIPVRPLSGWGK
jgi:hypothetical protein